MKKNMTFNHKRISFIKSLIRMVGYLVAISELSTGLIILLIAELLGIVEEHYEK